MERILLRGQEPAVGCREAGRLLGCLTGLCTQRQSGADTDPSRSPSCFIFPLIRLTPQMHTELSGRVLFWWMGDGQRHTPSSSLPFKPSLHPQEEEARRRWWWRRRSIPSSALCGWFIFYCVAAAEAELRHGVAVSPFRRGFPSSITTSSLLKKKKTCGYTMRGTASVSEINQHVPDLSWSILRTQTQTQLYIRSTGCAQWFWVHPNSGS